MPSVAPLRQVAAFVRNGWPDSLGIRTITTQSLESGFAMKIGAMLCRTYVKGRDWYDFIWYVNKKIAPDFDVLMGYMGP